MLRATRFPSLLALTVVVATLFGAAHGNEPVRGGNVTFIHQRLTDSLDANVWSSAHAARMMKQIYDVLVWQPEGGVYVPGLAHSWDISDDAREYTFYLREDVVFHDGTPFNAEAVKYTWERMRDPAVRSLRIGHLGPYNRSEVLDEYTIKIYFDDPYPVFLNNLSEVALAPSSPTAIEALGAEYALNPVGTGPFKVRGWEDDATLVLERNEDYAWAPEFMSNQATAYLDTITYRLIEESSTRLIALETGEADIIEDLPVQEYQRMLNQPGFETDTHPVPGKPFVMLVNITQSPTDDLAVRRAVLHAVDRQTLADLLFFGAFPPAYGPLSSSTWTYWPGVEDMYPYDPELAEGLLEEAGWTMNPSTGIREKDGEPLRINMLAASSQAARASEFYQASLLDIGIEWIIESMAYDATVVRYAANDYNVGQLGLARSDPNEPFYLAYHSSEIEGGAQFNRSRVADPELDALLERGASEPDPNVREEIYRDLQEWVMDQAYLFPVWETVLIHTMHDHVQDFSVDLLARPYMHDVWIQGR